MPNTPAPRNGGARPGAGRPRLYAEPTVAFSIRIPASWAALLRQPHVMAELRWAFTRVVADEKRRAKRRRNKSESAHDFPCAPAGTG
jgi:hypothetical protein